MPQRRHRSVEEFEAHLDLATRSALVVFPEFEVFKRCVAPIGGFAHASCECVCGPYATFCSDGWDMIARKHGTGKTAFAGTARLFGSWSEIVCPREAYNLVQDFVVDLKRFALADTVVTEAGRIDTIVAPPVTAVSCERERHNSEPAAETSTAGPKKRKQHEFRYAEATAFIDLT